MISRLPLDDFFDYLRFATVSADLRYKPIMLDCAKWLQNRFQAMDFRAEVYPTRGAPVVLARTSIFPKKKTVLIYGHYDVQPVDPLSLWRHDPFLPVVEDGLVIARGATDNKGQTFAHILGTAALLQSNQELPVNLIYLLEGEEEIGSPNLGEFLETHRAELACDVILISDTSMVAPDYPAITCGLRGIACVEVKLIAARTDLHSGMFGGLVPNPAQELALLLSKLHREDKSVAVPGFYDDLIPVRTVERNSWQNLPYDAKKILEATGAMALTGEEGFAPLERLWIRPTAEINGLTAGYQGSGSKTIIPREASAKLSLRLVPGQKADVIAQKIRGFFETHCPSYVRLEFTYDHGGEPYYSDPTSAFSRTAQNALEQVFGRKPALLREGLSIPVVSLLQKILLRDPLLIGIGLPDCKAHAPNETFPISHLQKGIELHQHLMKGFARN